MKDAGEFELRLSPEELEDLLATFAQPQLLTLEPASLAAMAAEQQTEAGLSSCQATMVSSLMSTCGSNG